MNKKGFTLVEILVAVVITGIVLVVSTSLSTLQQRSISSHQVRIEAQDIFAQIQRSFQNKISCNHNIGGGVDNLNEIYNRAQRILFKANDTLFKSNNFSFKLKLAETKKTPIPNAKATLLYLKFKLTFQGSKAIKSTFSMDQEISILVQGDDIRRGSLKCFSYDPTIYALREACQKVGESPSGEGILDTSGANLSCQFAHCKYGGFVPSQNKLTCPSGFDSLFIGTFAPRNGDGSSLKNFYLCLDCPTNPGSITTPSKIDYNNPVPPTSSAPPPPVTPPPPTLSITSISPTKGQYGTTITLTGTDFKTGAVISIGGVDCKTSTVNSATSASCFYNTTDNDPNAITSTRRLDVKVTNHDNSSITFTNGFEFIMCPADQGYYDGHCQESPDEGGRECTCSSNEECILDAKGNGLFQKECIESDEE